METEKKLRLKQFIFGVITFVILLNLVFSTKNKTKKGMNDYVATFNKIDGVGVGTNVEISGITVGEVEKVSIVKNYPQIYFSVKDNIKISDDSSISIQTDGLFGKKFLLIEVGGSDNYLKNGEKFSFSEDSIIIEELLRKIIEIGEKNKGL